MENGQNKEVAKTLTEGDTERRASGDRAVLELIVHEAEGDDEGVEEEEDEWSNVDDEASTDDER